jgi:DNA-binding protein HU-beta
MNRSELIDAIAQKSGVSKKDIGEVISALTDTVGEALEKGEKVALVGFGTFETRERAARNGRNPATGATMQIAAAKSPAFKAGAELKKRVNK